MKRSGGLLLAAGLCLFGQTSRESYRVAYRVAYQGWREAEPNLERDAGAARDTLAPRASHAAAEAVKYAAARATFLHELASDHARSLAEFQNDVPDNPANAPSPLELQRFIASETSAVKASITAFTNDTDPGIRRLGQALERERDALAALNSAIADRQGVEEKLARQFDILQLGRAKALEEYQSCVAALAGPDASVDNVTAAWASYYQKLTDGARGILAPVVLPASGEAASGGGFAIVVPPFETAPVPRTPSITLVPLTRYTGAWTYPISGGMFHGPAPELVDLSVREQDGKAIGILSARFKLPPGSSGDPVVHFDFAGDFRATKNQTFTLRTSDGTTGTVELIPGNAFNLLEVNFEIETKPGKIHQGDVLLVKK